MKANTKEWIQYGSAILMISSGVILTFLCFFLNHYDISDSVLWYVAQALVYAGSIFGVGMYIRTKLGDVSNNLKGYVDARMDEHHGPHRHRMMDNDIIDNETAEEDEND